MHWRLSPTRSWSLHRPRILAILNVTPDSFSDGGLHLSPDAALAAATQMLADGADGIDIGGESTRPGSSAVPVDEQLARVIPVIRAIRNQLGDAPAITIDTNSAAVAAAALDAGADAVNDISAGLDDPAMFPLLAARSRGIILMHRLRPPAQDSFSDRYSPADTPRYDNVTTEVAEFLARRALAAVEAGISHAYIVLDPGLGFGKSVEDNLRLITQTAAIAELGYPVLSGLSRKSFTARAAAWWPDESIANQAQLPVPPAPSDRLPATLALSAAHLRAGARIFRVHDVLPHVQALRAAWAARLANQTPAPD